ncbi:MAG TPA: NAD(P)/FAD-dependent oxidoreductase, partial [Pirellulales bacterium]|nr:NAD(P)/FAD-dependent oxidoreductase [Pirellulales bacterium]
CIGHVPAPLMTDYDAIIVGGGPAGLNAALVLGRCRRRVLICDAGHPRNAASHALHGFLSRDCLPPAELLRIGREQLARYPNVEFREVEVVAAACQPGGFEIQLPDGTRLSCRKLLLATGIMDLLPQLENIQAFYGRSVFHCPYCDGWEISDWPVAVYRPGKQGLMAAQTLTTWTADIVLLTEGPVDWTAGEQALIDAVGLKVHSGRVVRLEGRPPQLERIVFADGTHIECRALFVHTDCAPNSRLAEMLGCAIEGHSVKTDGRYDVEVAEKSGLYVAGDATREVELAIVAAAEGAKAAFAINKALLAEDLERLLGHAPSLA